MKTLPTASSRTSGKVNFISKVCRDGRRRGFRLPAPRTQMIERFWSHVRRARGGCWIWAGPTTRQGYGFISWNGRTTLAHRLAYEEQHGPIPKGMSCCHTCDHPRCCNPAHIFLGSQRDNVADMVAKGRHAKGEQKHTAKLNSQKVLAIRRERQLGWTYRELAGKYNVSQHTVWLITAGRLWRHV